MSLDFRIVRRSIGMAVLIGTLCLSQSVLQAVELRAGTARIDLTPPLSLKASLGGYGERMCRPAEGIHDRVFAKALVLGSGEDRFALVTADVLGFPPMLKEAVVSKLSDDGWTSDRIMLLPSHSHTSIEMMQIHPGNKLFIRQLGLFHRALFDRTVERLVTVIREAGKSLVTVRVGTAAKRLDGWNINRRDKSGPVDRQLTITRVDTDSGQPLAVLVNWTAHPTFMAAEDMWYSGGWPGHLQRTLEAMIGSEVTVMYYNGAEGDQRPISRSHSGGSHWERAERYGRELAIQAIDVYRVAKPRPDPTFVHHLEIIQLPKRTPHPQFMDTGGTEYGLTAKLMDTLLSTVFPDKTHSISLRIGQTVIVGVPGELAAGIGMEIKRQTAQITGATYPTIGGLADEWVSYILPSDEYEKGGYEASVSFYGSTLGDVLTKGVLRGVRQLGKKVEP